MRDPQRIGNGERRTGSGCGGNNNLISRRIWHSKRHCYLGSLEFWIWQKKERCECDIHPNVHRVWTPGDCIKGFGSPKKNYVLLNE